MFLPPIRFSGNNINVQKSKPAPKPKPKTLQSTPVSKALTLHPDIKGFLKRSHPRYPDTHVQSRYRDTGISEIVDQLGLSGDMNRRKWLSKTQGNGTLPAVPPVGVSSSKQSRSRNNSVSSQESQWRLPLVEKGRDTYIIQPFEATRFPENNHWISKMVTTLKTCSAHLCIPPSISSSFDARIFPPLAQHLNKPLQIFDVSALMSSINKTAETEAKEDPEVKTPSTKSMASLSDILEHYPKTFLPPAKPQKQTPIKQDNPPKFPEIRKPVTPWAVVRNLSLDDTRYLLGLEQYKLEKFFGKRRLIIQPAEYELSSEEYQERHEVEPRRPDAWEIKVSNSPHFTLLPPAEISLSSKERAAALQGSPLYAQEILDNYKMQVSLERLIQFITNLRRENKYPTDLDVVEGLSRFLYALENQKKIKAQFQYLSNEDDLSVSSKQIADYFKTKNDTDQKASPYHVDTKDVPPLSQFKRSMGPLKKVANQIITLTRANEPRSSSKLFDRTILLSGPPGFGKTLGLQAMAHTIQNVTGLDCELLKAAGSDFTGKWYGTGTKKVNAFIDAGVDAATRLSFNKGGVVILFIDEIDGTGNRAKVHSSDSQHVEIVCKLLDRVDGALSEEQKRERGPYPVQLIFVGATNRKDALDDGMLNRFKQKFVFKEPEGQKKKGMLKKAMSLQLELNAPLQNRDPKAVDNPQAKQQPHKVKPALIISPASSKRIHSKFIDDEASLRNLGQFFEQLQMGARIDRIGNQKYPFQVTRNNDFNKILASIQSSKEKRAIRIPEGRQKARERLAEISRNAKEREAKGIKTPPEESQGSKHRKRKQGTIRYKKVYSNKIVPKAENTADMKPKTINPVPQKKTKRQSSLALNRPAHLFVRDEIVSEVFKENKHEYQDWQRSYT
jgi:hypothetical protein